MCVCVCVSCVRIANRRGKKWILSYCRWRLSFRTFPHHTAPRDMSRLVEEELQQQKRRQFCQNILYRIINITCCSPPSPTHTYMHVYLPHTHTQRNISQTCTHISQPKICLIYRQGLWHQTQIQFNSVTLYSSQKGLCDCEPQTSSRLVDFFPSFFDSGRRCCCCFV